MVSLLNLAVSAALPVVNVFLMCLVGFGLAKKGILDPRGRQLLSQLVFWVFVPTLVFTKLAGSVNLSNLKVWWILPVNMIISISVGMVIGWLSARLLKVEEWFRKHFMCCIALGNVGNLPIVLVQSICSNRQTPYARLLPNGTCEQRGLGYVAFSMWIASTFQYCIAFNLMKKPKDLQLESKTRHSPNRMAMEMQNSAQPMSERRKQNRRGEAGSGEKTSKRPPGDEEEVSVLVHAGHSGNVDEEPPQRPGTEEARTSEAEEYRDGEPNAESEGLIGRRANSSGRAASTDSANQAWDIRSTHLWGETDAGASLRRKKQKEIQRWLKGIPWGSYLNMPTLGAIAGLSVGCISALKVLLFGDSAPLGFLTQSLEILAGGMVPCMMLILGSSLAKGPGTSSLNPKIVVACLIIRLVCIPAIGTGVVWAMFQSGLFQVPDSLFMLVLLLCHAPPTAMNLQTVATLNQCGEAEMATLLCWQYLAALVTIPLWMSVFVLITDP